MRSKGRRMTTRYFPEPDLLPLVVDAACRLQSVSSFPSFLRLAARG